MSNNYKGLHPVLWIAAIAVIAVSGVGIAKMSGWIGNETFTEPIASFADSSDKTTVRDAIRTPAKPAAPHEEYASREERAPSVNSYPARQRECSNCGVVEAVRTVQVPVKASGVGAVTGGVIGGVVGHQAGEGTGKDVATVAGAVLGGLAGHQVEKRVRTKTEYQVDVTMYDGTRRTIPFAGAPGWKRGDEVRIHNGALSAADKGRADSL